MGLNIAVLADDLTGANASAVALRSAGLRPMVGWGESVPQGGNAVAIDMRTRDRGNDPYRAAHSWGTRLAACGVDRVELRMDSTLRSATARELDGLLDALGRDRLVLVIPAFPSAGRTTRAGRQLAMVPVEHDGDVRHAVLGGEPCVSVGIEILGAGATQTLSTIQRAIAEGTRRFIFDGTTEAHLSATARVVGALERTGHRVVTVSPGAWLRYKKGSSFILIVLGSATQTNRAQLARIARGFGVLHKRLASPKAVKVIRGPVGSVAPSTIIIDTLVAREPGDPLLRGLATATVQAMQEQRPHPCAGIIVSGGHTASHLLDVLGSEAIVPLTEPEPLCAAGLLQGGPWDATFIITKGGFVGDQDTLERLRGWLIERHFHTRSVGVPNGDLLKGDITSSTGSGLTAGR